MQDGAMTLSTAGAAAFGSKTFDCRRYFKGDAAFCSLSPNHFVHLHDRRYVREVWNVAHYLRSVLSCSGRLKASHGAESQQPFSHEGRLPAVTPGHSHTCLDSFPA